MGTSRLSWTLSVVGTLLTLLAVLSEPDEWLADGWRLAVELTDKVSLPEPDTLLMQRAHAAPAEVSARGERHGGETDTDPPAQRVDKLSPIPAVRSADVPAERTGPVRLELLGRSRDLGKVHDAFGARSWVIVQIGRAHV